MLMEASLIIGDARAIAGGRFDIGITPEYTAQMQNSKHKVLRSTQDDDFRQNWRCDV